MAGKIIAFSGKGGSGKTTTTAMVLRHLVRTGHKPVLAVDADPNATLGLTLGVDVTRTIADLRDDMRAAAQNPSEIPKERLMDQLLNELICEESGFDLLTLGRPEGPQCYCYVNGLLRRYLSLLRNSYSVVLVDCEAGMEYLSRLVIDDVETLVLVAEDTLVGRTTATRVAELSQSLPMKVGNRLLALNKVGMVAGDDSPRHPTPAGVQAVVQIPFDTDLLARASRGQAVDDAAGPAARPAIEEIVSRSLGLPIGQAVAAAT